MPGSIHVRHEQVCIAKSHCKVPTTVGEVTKFTVQLPSHMTGCRSWPFVQILCCSYSRIKELGLLEHCTQLPSREGTPEEILKKHTPQTIEILKKTVEMKNADDLEELSSNYDAVFINNISYKTALLSVGCAIDLVDGVLKGDIQNGMAVIRWGIE